MGPLGPPELVAIFILALLLFGPKELPKLGKTIGKAMTEFRRAQTELKSTFNREMQNLERETGIRELAEKTLNPSTYNYDNSTYDSAFYNEDSYHSTVTTTSENGASAPQGAEHSGQLQITGAAGSIASGHMDAGHENAWDPYSPAATAAEHSHSASPSAWEPAEPAEKNG